jgi:hypothetical protein
MGTISYLSSEINGHSTPENRAKATATAAIVSMTEKNVQP